MSPDKWWSFVSGIQLAAADPGVLRANRNLSESLFQEQEANRLLTGSPNSVSTSLSDTGALMP